ncbi:MAG: hypothetical protein U5N85_22965 [Arcicella sp.]|nr:hypothetical protein [Arcicella sp.]
MDTDNKSSILYRAVLSFVFTKSKKDWKGYSVQDEDLEDHHLFPKRSITKNLGVKGSENYINTVLNKVLISKSANNETRDDSPDKYLKDFNNLPEFIIPDSFKINAIPNTFGGYQDCLKKRYDLIKFMLKERVISCLEHSK